MSHHPSVALIPSTFSKHKEDDNKWNNNPGLDLIGMDLSFFRFNVNICLDEKS